jgi:DNA-binding Lrp family transcriptional regulator
VTQADALDAIDRRLLVATQAGLPLEPRPYHAIAAALDRPAEEIMQRMRALLARGVIRRIGAVPNHYALGVRANAMAVWDVPDARVDAIGRTVGALDCVSHCYRRPRHPPLWPYNLFVMLHGQDRAEVETNAAMVATRLGGDCRDHALLYSTRILKKTGLRLAG